MSRVAVARLMFTLAIVVLLLAQLIRVGDSCSDKLSFGLWPPGFACSD